MVSKQEDYNKAARLHRIVAMLYIPIAGVLFYGAFKSGSWAAPIVVLFLIGIHFSCSGGLKNNKKWAKVISAIIGVLLLFGFPIGTIVGGGLLFYLFKNAER